MLLYLVRHGKAEPGANDDDRTLTDAGRRSISSLADGLAGRGLHVSRIEHSGLVRAEQTAEIIAKALDGKTVRVAGLRPDDDVETTARRVKAASEDLMLVGHLPFMNRLSAYLLTGDPGIDLLHMRTGAVACLSWSRGSWTLEWFLYPDIS